MVPQMKTDQSPSIAVVRAVADEEGVDAVELSAPLADSIDPDALDALFRNSHGHITFSYLGYRVTVESTGTVDVEPRTPP